jgi:hypothetical protein
MTTTQKVKKPNLKVIRNYDYTISVIDGKNNSLTFRDITGKTLEYLETLLSESPDGQRRLTHEGVVNILNLLCVDNIDFIYLPRRITLGIFDLVRDEILCNFMPKYEWLRSCYAIQNGSFANVSNMEEVPMTKFVAMLQVHEEAIKSINNGLSE